MSYTQEQIDRANQVNLEQFLRSQGEKLIKSGYEYRWERYDSLTVKGNKWFRHSQSKGGYPIDFVMEFFDKTFPEAVQMLIGENTVECAEEIPLRAEFKLPPRCESNERIIKYLTEERKLPKDLVEEFIANGLIYEDAKHHNVIFVGNDENGIPRYAHCRGTAGQFRMDVSGSDKSYGFCYRGKGTELYVVEAPIDLLHYITLYLSGWRERSYLSLGGVSPKALERFLSERKDIESVFIATDNDEAGNNAAEKLAEFIPQEISVYRFLPQAKDWNEELIKEQTGLASDAHVVIGIRKPEKPAKSVPVICMDDVEQTEVDWLWYPYIPFGKLTIVQGNPGEGKTFFSMQLAAACINQKFLPDMEPFEPFNMIFQTAEDGLGDTVKPRLVSSGADLKRVLVIDDTENPLTLAFSLGDQKGFRWIGAYDISAEDLLAGGEGSKAELKQEQAIKLIYEFLADGKKVSIAEINKEAIERGISERTVRLARNSMKDKLESERQGKDW